MSEPTVFMPDGTPFAFWDDTTDYWRVYHVSAGHPSASDGGPGTEERPFATISRAAQILEPREKALVHAGVYRECVRPARGGEGPDRMIAYEAAPGEEVTVCGSERWTPDWLPSEEWNWGPLPAGATVWAGDLPEQWFAGFNPFMARNFSSEYTTFTSDWTPQETHCFMLRRGMVFAGGVPLKQVFFPVDLGGTAGAFWVEDPGLRLYLRLAGDADPHGVVFEVTAREQVFAPRVQGLGFIRVSGLHFAYAADGIPVPQRAVVSASRGHHWIIEDCTVRWANACGIDVGDESWHRPQRTTASGGGHILRRNHVSDCGICGMAAVGNNQASLVEDNTVERIGAMQIERIWETAGLKFHVCDGVLIRRNVFRHIRGAPGLWLDYTNRNSRVTGNVFADIESIHGGVYIEVSHAPNAVDHNLFWDIRGSGNPRWGPGVNVDTGEQCVVAHNLFARIRDGWAVSVNLDQSARIVAGRVGLCRQHQLLNNLFIACPKRILFSRAADNRSDGNLFDASSDETSLCIETPQPAALLDLAAWQRYYGLDEHGRQGVLEAQFDPQTLLLRLEIQGELPTCPPVEALHEPEAPRTPGPLGLGAGVHEVRVQAGRITQLFTHP